jgi:GT2 family glycosyltransferase
MAPPPFRCGVVIVNWNGHADTIACLESLGAAVPPPVHIVVVDNASTDGSMTALERWRAARPAGPPPVTLLGSTRNRGYAGAANVGLARLAADPALTHFLLLNNDTTVEPALFARLAEAVAVVPEGAILGPTIFAAEEGPSLREAWYAGGYFVPLRALVVHRHVVSSDSRPVPTEFVTGCAMLISRRAWEALGPLPECYFMYLEDAEYCARATAQGLPVLYAPAAVVRHAVGATVDRLVPSPVTEGWVARNRVLFARRNLRGATRWGALAYLAVTKPGRALLETLRGRPAVGWAILRGTVAGLLSKDGDREARQAAAVQDPRDGVLVHE